MDEAPLDYARRDRRDAGRFAARFITLATIGLMLAAAAALVDLVTLPAAIHALGTTDGGTLAVIAFVGLATLAVVRLALDAALAVACLLVLTRAATARAALLAFARIEWVAAGLAVAVTLAAAAAPELRRDGRSLVVTLAVGVAAARLGVASVARREAWGPHGDFYFKGRVVAPDAAPPAVPFAVARVAPPRFRVTGLDRATREPVTFDSRAATEPLARASALTLGLDRDTLEVEPIDDA